MRRSAGSIVALTAIVSFRVVCHDRRLYRAARLGVMYGCSLGQFVSETSQAAGCQIRGADMESAVRHCMESYRTHCLCKCSEVPSVRLDRPARAMLCTGCALQTFIAVTGLRRGWPFSRLLPFETATRTIFGLDKQSQSMQAYNVR